MRHSQLPRLLIIDDLFGRSHSDRPNVERANLCGQLLLEDITGDEEGKGSQQRIRRPIAEAVFIRGQRPQSAVVGDAIENDLEACLQTIHSGWSGRREGEPPWAMLLLIYSAAGRVTETSNANLSGMPEGRRADDDPESYFRLEILQAAHQRFRTCPPSSSRASPDRT